MKSRIPTKLPFGEQPIEVHPEHPEKLCQVNTCPFDAAPDSEYCEWHKTLREKRERWEDTV